MGGEKVGLTADGDTFKLDGKDFRILSGAIHYFRIPKQSWKHRLQSVVDCGLNTIDVYIPWNLHEKERGNFDFGGELDLVEFFTIAAEMGLKVLCRPGPYICSEWDWGGLPSWLLKDPKMHIRSNYCGYQAAVSSYFSKLLPLLAPLQHSNGGPIIAFQVENEYGDYVDKDNEHLPWLADLMKSHGLFELFFISDGGHTIRKANMLKLTKSTPISLKSLQPNKPMLVTEFWAGWFDYWGHGRNLLNNDVFEKTLKEILKRGASVNFYMFHGGTNFGFMNGAIELEKGYYTADVTSYDYDCPVDESGNRTEKWEIIKRCLDVQKTSSENVYKNEAEAYGEFEAEKMVKLCEIGISKELDEPTNMENLDQAFGYTSYSVFIAQPEQEPVKNEKEEKIEDIEDEPISPVFFKNLLKSIREKRSFLVEFLIENPGRVNFSNLKDQRMGMISAPKLVGASYTSSWNICCYPLDKNQISSITAWTNYLQTAAVLPALFKTTVKILDYPKDTFILMHGWSKGVIFVNGRNLGRYWVTKGPQKTLYLPASWLIKGENEIIWLEEEQLGMSIELVSSPDLG
ncbi:unnamed protein product [Oikopleura dioica]|uniref:Uncharacterized protein n=1 Tax=Oikopleura dioica TaxID=34765 RepID=E4YE50_OIKDI|nr:unnamed protein product [Oikopleura dioica]